jgi:hypothetical protein
MGVVTGVVGVEGWSVGPELSADEHPARANAAPATNPSTTLYRYFDALIVFPPIR